MNKIINERKELLDRVNFSSTEEMVSLNETTNQEFFVEQLEERLETDPLMVGGLFDLIAQTQADLVPYCEGFYDGEIICDRYYW